MRPRSAHLLAVVALAALVALPGISAARSSPTTPPSSSTVLLTDAVPLPAGAVSHPLDGADQVGIVVTLPFADSAALTSLLNAVENPYSPLYHHFLTAPEFNAEFDPSSAAVDQVESELRAFGASDLAVGSDRATVSAVLTAEEVHALFGVELVQFGQDGAEPLYTSVGAPHLPSSLEGLVTGVGGLTDAANPDLRLAASEGPVRPLSDLRGPSDFVLNGTTQWFLGADFTQAYGATDLFPGGTIGPAGRYPTDIAVATLLASSYNESTNSDLPPWDPNVVYTYFNNSSSPAWPRPTLTGVPVTVNGVTPPLPGSLAAYNDTTGDEFENSLDLEMAGSLAPGAHLFNFYFAGSVIVAVTTVSDLADDFAADLGSALNYAYGGGLRLGVVSGSFGLPDLSDAAWNSDLVEAAATGVTVVIASGDQGNAPNSLTGRGDGQWPTWPATASFNTSGALAVGGVTLTLDGVPTTVWNGTSLNVTYDSNITGIAGMTAWWDNTGPQGTWAGSEGGLSEVTDEPAWQFNSAAQPAIAAAGDRQGASFLGRAEPDLAFPANTTLAYVLADRFGNLYFDILEGTSIAAPVLAGLLADEAAVLNTSFGYLDPALYRMGSYFAANPNSAADPFFDVTIGANYVFSAGTGWDATTGWGGFAAFPFYTALQNSTVTGYNYTGPTPGLTPPAPAPSAGFPLTAVVVIVVLGIAAAIALVVAFGRPKRPVYAQPPPWGPTAGYQQTPPWPSPQYPQPPPAGTGYRQPAPVGPGYPQPPPSAATFLCPYCGSARPAEPVRCPHCGAL